VKLDRFIGTPKWDWYRRLREEEKKEKRLVNNNETHHIFTE
jgi:hypothetical protein